MMADGSGVTRLTNDAALADDPAWSPDGSKIAFASGGHICMMNADGTGVTRLTSTLQHVDRAPTWSPDGAKIAFQGQFFLSSFFDIYVMNAGGTGLTRLTFTRFSGAPAWSPDGRKIAFGSTGGIYVMNADGSGVIRLTQSAAFDGELA